MSQKKSELNCVLKKSLEIDDAVKSLEILNLPPHLDRVKSWDTWKIINFINSNGDKDSKILDVGCNGSPILAFLRKLGFKNLYGCDVDLNVRKQRFLRRMKNKFSSKESGKLINEMLENKDQNYRLSIQDHERTNYEDSFFDFISSLSVIEHGVNIQNYFSEMSRIIKKGGFLLTSTDYWPEKNRNCIKCL